MESRPSQVPETVSRRRLGNRRGVFLQAIFQRAADSPEVVTASGEVLVKKITKAACR